LDRLARPDGPRKGDEPRWAYGATGMPSRNDLNAKLVQSLSSIVRKGFSDTVLNIYPLTGATTMFFYDDLPAL
jgi:hypothetical protein